MSATENISEGTDGILLEAILEGFAEYYSVELAEKIKRSMTENALKLRSNSVRAPIGYLLMTKSIFKLMRATRRLSGTYSRSIMMARMSARLLN